MNSNTRNRVYSLLMGCNSSAKGEEIINSVKWTKNDLIQFCNEYDCFYTKSYTKKEFIRSILNSLVYSRLTHQVLLTVSLD